MLNQKHQEVLDLYHTLGIAGIESVKTTFSNGQINGWFLSEAPLEESPPEQQNDYSSSTEQ